MPTAFSMRPASTVISTSAGLDSPSALMRSASLVAMLATWRVERPDATTMWRLTMEEDGRP